MVTFCQGLALNDTKQCVVNHRCEIQAFLLEKNVMYDMPKCFECTVGFRSGPQPSRCQFFKLCLEDFLDFSLCVSLHIQPFLLLGVIITLFT